MDTNPKVKKSSNTQSPQEAAQAQHPASSLENRISTIEQHLNNLNRGIQELHSNVGHVAHAFALDHLPALTDLLPSLSPTFTPPSRYSTQISTIPALPKLRVACILDDLSSACFDPETFLIHLDPRKWKHQLEASDPDLLLIESAWKGRGHQWQSLAGSQKDIVVDIVQWCRAKSIPTFFWNKEDPVHHEAFLHLSTHFDFVGTTDVASIPSYAQRIGSERSFFFPFAAQPRLHNPITTWHRQDGLSFAGAYYTRFPRRCTAFESISNAVDLPLVIFDRTYGLNRGFQFPEKYRSAIAGRLSADIIDLAHKGFTTALNLNSVTDSPTMVSRRLYELVASGTLTISSYAPAVPALFGDSVLCSDSGLFIQDQLKQIRETPGAEEELIASGLRIIFHENTYSNRLARLSSLAGITLSEGHQSVCVLTSVSTEADADTLARMIDQQTRLPALIINLGRAHMRSTRVPSIEAPSLHEALDVARQGYRYLGVLDPRHDYGPMYFEDLLTTWKYADVGAAHKLSGTASGTPFTHAEEFNARAGLALTESVTDGRVSDDGIHLEVARDNIMCLNTAQYAPPGGQLLPQSCHKNPSTTLSSFEALATRDEDSQVRDGTEIDLARFSSLFDSNPQRCSIALTNDRLTVTSKREGSHDYLYCREPMTLADLSWKTTGYLHLATPHDDLVRATLIFNDLSGKRISHKILPANTGHTFDIPEGTHSVLFGFRMAQSGQATVTRLSVRPQQPVPVLTEAPVLVLTGDYPSYDRHYANTFVATRVQAYEKQGLDRIVGILDSKPTFREFQGTTVIEGSRDHLRAMISKNNFSTIAVHFLTPELWEVIQDYSGNIVVWLHGSEVQPHWRRPWKSATTSDNILREESVAKLQFWKTILSSTDSRLHFVFVSQYFAEEVFEDVGVTLSRDSYSIIPNPIDTDLFTFEHKDPAHRLKVLSIRPYASEKYANDLAVKAVIELSQDAQFNDYSFCFVGDGPQFHDVTAPLTRFPNVQLRKEFLDRTQIAELHREYGIFLCPTRMDSQGVSRDEAMSSGLVPVTHAVAATPEFVTEKCGVVAPPESFVDLADGIRQLAQNPHQFQEMSRQAASHVRSISSIDRVISLELQLLTRVD